VRWLVNGSLRSTLLLGSALLLAPGCASGPVEVKAVPDARADAACPSGAGVRLTGTSFSRQRNGKLVSGASRPVYLDPATRYSAAVFRAIVEHQNKKSFFAAEKESGTVVPDPSMLKCRRTVQADVEGKFTFTDVPPGSYFVSSYVSWIKPEGELEWVGMWNLSPVEIRADGKAVDVVLSGGPETIADPPAR
jgi:hypothetical protein